MDVTLKWPFNMLVCGPTQSGKTMWVIRLLKHMKNLIEKPPKRILWYSPHETAPAEALSLREDSLIPTLIHYRGLPWTRSDAGKASSRKVKLDKEEEIDSSDEEADPPPTTTVGDLVIIDDFAEEIANSRELTAYLTRHSHHQGISILLISQNCFWAGRESRTQSLNMHYIVLMRQKRDQKQVRTLARQISTGEASYTDFMHAYNDATSQRQFAYLLVSMHPRDDEALLLRTNIFPDDSTPSAAIVYMTRKRYKRLGKQMRYNSTVDNDKKEFKQEDDDGEPPQPPAKRSRWWAAEEEDEEGEEGYVSGRGVSTATPLRNVTSTRT